MHTQFTSQHEAQQQCFNRLLAPLVRTPDLVHFTRSPKCFSKMQPDMRGNGAASGLRKARRFCLIVTALPVMVKWYKSMRSA